jgi:hypothetical protein
VSSHGRPPRNRARRRSLSRRALRNRPPRLDAAIRRKLGDNRQPADDERRLGFTEVIGRYHKRHHLKINATYTFDRHVAMRALNIVRRSQVAPYLDEYLRDHPGATPPYGAEALLVGWILAGWTGSARRTSVTQAIAALPVEMRFRLRAFSDEESYSSPSYRSILAQMLRLERALATGWVASDGTICDLDWLNSCLLQASVPASHAKRIRACVIDGTDLETWARPRYRVRKAEEEAISDAVPEDAALTYRRTLTDSDGDLPEPAPAAVPHGERALPPAETTGQDGDGKRSRRKPLPEYGPDGRRIGGPDLEARWGWRSATNTRDAGYYLGYELHVVVATTEFCWQGDPTRGQIKGWDGERRRSVETKLRRQQQRERQLRALRAGAKGARSDATGSPGQDEEYDDNAGEEPSNDHFPLYILGLVSTPAGSHRGEAGKRAMRMALGVCSSLRDVVADRAYTMCRAEAFRRYLHELGINLTMDFSTAQRARVHQLAIPRRGGATDVVVMNCGTVLHPSVPEHRQSIKGHPTPKDDKDGSVRSA